MPTYAKDTTVSVESSKSEIERTLKRYGANSFMYGWDQNQAIIGFDIDGKRYKMSLPMPDQSDFQFTKTGRPRSGKLAISTAWEQGQRQRWRAMALWIKAVLEAAESGIVMLEEALQPFIVLPNGQTAGQWLAPQIELAYQSGQMPPLLLSGE